MPFRNHDPDRALDRDRRQTKDHDHDEDHDQDLREKLLSVEPGEKYGRYFKRHMILTFAATGKTLGNLLQIVQL